jgi:hypothetical protein
VSTPHAGRLEGANDKPEFQAIKPKTAPVATHCEPSTCRSVTWKDLHGFVALRLRAFVVRLQLRAFTLYGATKIVAWATRLLAERTESFGGRIVPLCSQAPDIDAEPPRAAL